MYIARESAVRETQRTEASPDNLRWVLGYSFFYVAVCVGG
jgi:hypothetical protein